MSLYGCECAVCKLARTVEHQSRHLAKIESAYASSWLEYWRHERPNERSWELLSADKNNGYRCSCKLVDRGVEFYGIGETMADAVHSALDAMSKAPRKKE